MVTNNTGARLGQPSAVFYLYNHDGTTEGPLTFQQANSRARRVSHTNATGLACILTFEGPLVRPELPFVKYGYLRGQCLFGTKSFLFEDAPRLAVIP